MNNILQRKIALDIETTGFNRTGLIYSGHKIIEIGAVEIINRKLTGNNFHVYLNPGREIDIQAFKIHGISSKFLKDKPKFSDVYLDFIKYIKDSIVIAHNSDFDISFLNHEIKNINYKFKSIASYCKIIDTLKIARKIFPGKKNNLDALCNRYKMNSIGRNLHSAITDANILAKIYLRMTTVQKVIDLDNLILKNNNLVLQDVTENSNSLRILKASKIEQKEHRNYLKNIGQKKILWMDKKF
ncbi:DNA polymerase III subunit epsilon [Buchnera aphidicola]|uniref:DNA polymerase III subunit epsilon n=1 Tax=Buchnera aphidicola (Sarucallis kahawaluokalani) TaxID=1241878 RepID=A0A4D6Y8I2_9GAMM|nr:DNA polymerase III subunit epsilon [Buchnera aphidicola]QCI25967.1 DNA polymerase III subunit epsilon [Buchnera aphidicola (Sarucallis kahawaluokalani)]